MSKKMNPDNKTDEIKIGSSQSFVLARGLQQVGGYWVLMGEDGRQRLFAELTADTDRLDVRPVDAYQALLSSIQPGWTVRMLQIFWPDPLPRRSFQKEAEGWAKPNSEGLEILREGLLLAIEESSLPFIRRTIIEYVLPPNNEGLAWWGSIPGMCLGYGIEVAFLNSEEIQALAQWILNPSLE